MTPADVTSRRVGRTAVVEIRGPLGHVEARQLCDQVQALLRADRGVICDLRGSADLGVVDALARLHLMARRLDAWLRVRATGEELAGLLELTGLGTAVPAVLVREGLVREGLVRVELEARRQAEAGEQRGVEEVVNVHDLPG